MPPYFRLPDPKAINQKLWGMRPRNPTCGLIGLEKGTKIFAWMNIIYGAAFSIMCVIIMIMIPYSSKLQLASSREISKTLNKTSEHGLINKSARETTLLSHAPTLAAVQSAVFFTFILSCTWWFISWKLKKAVVERDLSQLKKYYLIMLPLMVLWLMATFFESEMAWHSAFLFEIPNDIIQIMGLIFTHGYIVSLMSSDCSQDDDLNRIQVNL